jgi:chromosome partitioning protein
MIITVGGTKGGTGKSTLAVNLAAMRAQAGYAVMLIDTDHQQTSLRWSRVRGDEHPGALSVPTRSLTGDAIWRSLHALSGENDIVVDSGGRDTHELRQAVSVSDLFLVPLQASQFDLETLDVLAPIVDEAHNRGIHFDSWVVLTRVPTHPTMFEWREARDFVGDYQQFSLASAMIRERVAWRRSAEDGLSILEMSRPDQRAIDELRTLYKDAWGEAYAEAT